MMPGKSLSQEEIKAILAPTAKKAAKPQANPHTVVPQNGPLKYSDKEQACLNSGYYTVDAETGERYYKKTSTGKCGSSTHFTLDGIPYCHIHLLYRMNEMLMEFRGIPQTEVREVA
jgi:hypothetical protein